MPTFRIPWFHPVPSSPRRDGWDPRRQAEFLGQLYLLRSVTGAARAVGRSRESAYRLRARPMGEGFASAWDHALCVLRSPPEAPRPKVTLQSLVWRVEIGWWRPVIGPDSTITIDRKPDNSALLRLLARLDRLEERIGCRAGQRDEGFFHNCMEVFHPTLRKGRGNAGVRFLLEGTR